MHPHPFCCVSALHSLATVSNRAGKGTHVATFTEGVCGLDKQNQLTKVFASAKGTFWVRVVQNSPGFRVNVGASSMSLVLVFEPIERAANRLFIAIAGTLLFCEWA